MTKRMLIGLLPILMIGVALLFAASTAPPLIGAQALNHQTYNYANHDTSGGLKAYAAPEVQPGATNAGGNLLFRSLLAMTMIGLIAGFYAFGATLRANRPSLGVAAGVGEACAT